MASTFSNNKGYELMATGEDDGTWGIKSNANLALIDSNLGGRFNPSIAGSGNFDVTAPQAENVAHVLTGVLTGARTYRLPNVGGYYIITNNTTGTFNVTISNIAGGSGVVLPRGGTGLYFINPDGPSCQQVFAPSSADGRQYWGGTSTGSANAQAITVPQGVGPALSGGQVFNWLPGFTNTGATTLNVNGLGVGNILRMNGAPLSGGEIVINAPAAVIFDGAQFRLLSQQYQGGLINVRYFTTPGSLAYTPTVGTNKVRVICVGGGGGGGGVVAATSAQAGSGRSGGGGGYAEDFLTSGFAGVTITVGGAGAGGAAGFHNGTVGGTSSFGGAVIATGGEGGLAAGAGAVPQAIGGSQGGSGTAGSLLATGGQSQAWLLTSLTQCAQGNPGAAVGYGQPITGRISAGNGAAPGTYGCGGQGGVVFASGAAAAGGNGTAGFVMVEEYA